MSTEIFRSVCLSVCQTLHLIGDNYDNGHIGIIRKYIENYNDNENKDDKDNDIDYKKYNHYHYNDNLDDNNNNNDTNDSIDMMI